jgi:cytochrome c5
MKKLSVLFFLCTAVVISCGKKIVPGTEVNSSSNNGNEKTTKSATQPVEQNNSRTTTPSFNDMQSSIPPPMESPRNVSMEKGKTVFVTKCGTCHALKNPGDYTEDQLNTILKVEIPKAKLDKTEAEQVTAYLIANSRK